MDKFSSQLGTYRWLTAGKRGIEGYLYVLHRITGLVLLAFVSVHVFVTASRLFGEQAWSWVMALTDSPFVRFAEYLVFIAFAFHALNGVRLAAIELGFAIGHPDEPVFPYKGSISRQRPLMIATMILAGILVLLPKRVTA